MNPLKSIQDLKVYEILITPSVCLLDECYFFMIINKFYLVGLNYY